MQTFVHMHARIYHVYTESREAFSHIYKCLHTSSCICIHENIVYAPCLEKRMGLYDRGCQLAKEYRHIEQYTCIYNIDVCVALYSLLTHVADISMYISLYCSILLYISLYYSILLYITVYFSTLLYITLYCSILLYIAQYFSIFLYISLYCFILLYISLYYHIFLYISPYFSIFLYISSRSSIFLYISLSFCIFLYISLYFCTFPYISIFSVLCISIFFEI